MIIRHNLFALTLALWLPMMSLAQSGAYDFAADITEGCDSVRVKFTFVSTATVDTITEYAWDFGNGESSYVKDPDTVFYNVPGPYTIILFYGSSPTNMLENDPIIKSNYVTVYPTIKAGFTYADTTEIGYYAVSFKHDNQPYSNAGIYSWDFGDGSASGLRNVIHTYSGPGTYNVRLKVSTPFGCADSSEQTLILNVPPGLPDIVPSETFGCGEARVKFTLGNVDTDTITSVSWDFGNGQTSNLVDPDTVVYNKPGYYGVEIVINNDNAHRVAEDSLVQVQLLSPADFSYTDTVTYDTYVLEHTGETDPAATYTYSWDIESVGSRTGPRVVVKFPAPDSTYRVQLTVSDNFGCSDASETAIYVFEELQVQNVFSPNGDGINDFFEVNSNETVLLSLQVFTRTGTLVYEAEGTRITWDGRTAWGLDLSQGIYYYILNPLGEDPNDRYHKTGFIYLYR
jgi:gliding motility-associated-like protein